MIIGGYILQPRKIDESAISKSPPHVREIWLYILRNANHSDKKVSGITIKRGELFTSYSEIINDLSWFVGFRKESYKPHHCETAMKTMMKAAMITARKTTRGMIITICNYDYYQDPKNYETDDDNRNDSDTITGTSPHYKQECKNVKNVSKEYTSTLLSQIEAQYPNLNPDYIEIAKAFQTLFRNNLISAGASPKVADNMKGTSIDDIRLIIEADGYTVEDLRQVFDVLRTNDFWKKNVLSTKALRKQMTRLKLEKHGDDKKSGKTGANRDFHELAAIIHAVTAE